MITINARNVNQALIHGRETLYRFGLERESRNGPVLVMPTPVTTAYRNPTERVMLYPPRDANPFFHLVEALWMLAGRNDLGTLTKYVSTFGRFSDDGKTLHGAYGYRWRRWFSCHDQIEWAVKRLKADPNDRRVVIGIYDPDEDWMASDRGGKDIPCNLMILPAINVPGQLDFTVFNRSNDMIWGAYGANAVHFSFLQEVMAGLIGVPVGAYYQVSNNFHAYKSTLHQAGEHHDYWDYDPYELGEVRPDPSSMYDIDRQRTIDLPTITDDINLFLADPTRIGLRWSFLKWVARPMVLAHQHYKTHTGEDRYTGAIEILTQMNPTNDWRAGGLLWINKRYANWRRAADDGVSHESN